MSLFFFSPSSPFFCKTTLSVHGVPSMCQTMHQVAGVKQKRTHPCPLECMVTRDFSLRFPCRLNAPRTSNFTTYKVVSVLDNMAVIYSFCRFRSLILGAAYLSEVLLSQDFPPYGQTREESALPQSLWLSSVKGFGRNFFF